MNTPQFTAQASLYRTSRHYVTSASAGWVSAPPQSAVTAQVGERFAQCDPCELSCAKGNVRCQASASSAYAVAAIACAAAGPFAPICEGIAGGAYAGAIGACYGWWGECVLECWLPGGDCCPVFCELGHCCSEGERCIPHGCCPNEQVVCNGKCCSPGEICCGDTCCAPGQTCCGGTCCPNNCCGNTCCDAGVPCCGDRCCSFDPGPPPPPPAHSCAPGAAPCGFPDNSGVIRTCCPPGLQCCSYSPQFGPDCRTSCLH